MYIVQNSQFSADISHNFNLEYVNRPVHSTVFKPLPTSILQVCTPTYRCTVQNISNFCRVHSPNLYSLPAFLKLYSVYSPPPCPNCTVYSVHFFNDYVYRTRTKKGCITLFSQFISKLSVTHQYKICS